MMNHFRDPTKMIERMMEIKAIERNGTVIGFRHFPGRKKPALVVDRDGKSTKYGYADNDQKAEEFMNALIDLVTGKDNEENESN